MTRVREAVLVPGCQYEMIIKESYVTVQKGNKCELKLIVQTSEGLIPIFIEGVVGECGVAS